MSAPLRLVAVDGTAVEPSGRPTLAEVEARVEAIRSALTFSIVELARLRADEAHIVSGFATWHEACEAWFGDLRELRLTGSSAAVEERRALVASMREAGEPTRAIRTRLGVSAGTVDTDLRTIGDPAPEVVVGDDGRTRSARTGRREVLSAPTGRVYEQAAEWLRRSPEGLTLVELARVAGWTEGKASGALSDCVRRKGTAVRTEEQRDGQRVHRAVEDPS